MIISTLWQRTLTLVIPGFYIYIDAKPGTVRFPSQIQKMNTPSQKWGKRIISLF
jgi:hypothetical protein